MAGISGKRRGRNLALATLAVVGGGAVASAVGSSLNTCNGVAGTDSQDNSYSAERVDRLTTKVMFNPGVPVAALIIAGPTAPRYAILESNQDPNTHVVTTRVQRKETSLDNLHRLGDSFSFDVNDRAGETISQVSVMTLGHSVNAMSITDLTPPISPLEITSTGLSCAD